MAQFPLLIAWQRYFPARSQSRNVEALFNILVVEREVTNLCHDKNMLDVPIPINRNESGSDLDSLEELPLLSGTVSQLRREKGCEFGARYWLPSVHTVEDTATGRNVRYGSQAVTR